jgi:hypothetical protein
MIITQVIKQPVVIGQHKQTIIVNKVPTIMPVYEKTLVINTGAVSLNSIKQIALRDIGGLRVLLTDQSYADNSDILSFSKVLGISKGAVSTGSTLEIVTASELSGFTGLISNELIYLGLNGLITQTVPTQGILQKLGIATSSTTIQINIDEPLLLA